MRGDDQPSIDTIASAQRTPRIGARRFSEHMPIQVLNLGRSGLLILIPPAPPQ
jgi:hypothetical protein